ncbi:hypothetical protein [Bacillus sp. T33-2]|nr:hypothetical protein [Bacillus sp. T33-2]
MEFKEMAEKLLEVQKHLEGSEIMGTPIAWKDISWMISYIEEVRQELKRK